MHVIVPISTMSSERHTNKLDVRSMMLMTRIRAYRYLSK